MEKSIKRGAYGSIECTVGDLLDGCVEVNESIGMLLGQLSERRGGKPLDADQPVTLRISVLQDVTESKGVQL